MQTSWNPLPFRSLTPRAQAENIEVKDCGLDCKISGFLVRAQSLKTLMFFFRQAPSNVGNTVPSRNGLEVILLTPQEKLVLLITCLQSNQVKRSRR